MGRSEAGRKATWRRGCLAAALLAASLPVVAVGIRMGRMARYSAVAAKVEGPLRRHLGLEHGTPYVDGREVFLITRVEPGKPMDRAGLREGDQVRWWAVPTLYIELALNQGGTARIPIRRDGREMEVEVEVPDLGLEVSRPVIHDYALGREH